MKLRFILILILFSSNIFSQEKGYKPKLEPYVNFLEKNKFKSAKNYILSKFETKDIVIISERDHRDLSQYDVYFEVLKDPRFKGNVYTEIGSFNNYKRINKFLQNSNLSEKEKEKELLSIYRDLSFDVIWEKYNYYALLKTVYQINKMRESNDKILLFPLDLEFDWKEFDCHSQYKLFDDYSEYGTIDRNVIMGKHFVRFFEYAKKRNQNRKMALVIENTYHGYVRIPKYIPLPTRPEIYSTGEYIYKTYPEITTNIYVNYYTQGFFKGLTNNGLFDAAFDYTKIDNIGFDLKKTPFGNSKFDLYNFGGTDYEKVNFDYIFDGMIFYKPISEMNLVVGIPNVYPEGYEKQFYERWTLVDGITYEQSKNENREYLQEINEIKSFNLPDSIKQKINNQINYWLK
ncbi:MAG TPA: hypothetical protein EYG92_00985 [Lutibacter sp.]|nr:hypothetical protein [Lutibacter sp.]